MSYRLLLAAALLGAAVPRPAAALVRDDARGAAATAETARQRRLRETIRHIEQRFLPSYARQTKLACQTCHYQFPQLTPFGRQFKLNGYVLTGLPNIQSKLNEQDRRNLDLAPFPPASFMVVAGATHTASPVPGRQNDNVAFPQQASLFLAGEITPKIGGFAQFTYSSESGTFSVDNIDLRFADRATLAGRRLTYGVTLHNNPTSQDVWNTVPAWGFPFMSSSGAPTPTAATQIDGALAGQVLGLGAYGMWNDLLYAEATVYRSAQQRPIPLDSAATNVLSRVSPYWRVALQHGFESGWYGMVGAYGLWTSQFPVGVTGLTNRYSDVALDAQLEKPTKDYGAFIVRTAWITERQRLNAGFASGGADNVSNSLNTVRINASWMPSLFYSASLGYFQTTGSADRLVYAPGPITGSFNGLPNSRGVTGELTWNAWQNTRFGVQYTAYQRFNGAGTAYDVAGGRNASDNNTLYLFTWIAY